jgi:GNAT superfamily N-acetyltransferase
VEKVVLLSSDFTDAVMGIYRRATARMDEQGILQWDDVYPDRATIEADITAGTLYGFFVNGVLCAVQVLNEVQSNEYAAIPWKFSDRRPLVLHRLCVDPVHQNKGISKKMILFAEEFAEEHGYRTIRFDAFVDNHISVGIYRRMGFAECGTVTFRKGEFYCFEKRIHNVFGG